VVVELQGNADNVVPGFAHQGGNDRRIDTTRHGHDYAVALCGNVAHGVDGSAGGQIFDHAWGTGDFSYRFVPPEMGRSVLGLLQRRRCRELRA
jgi:hypothetical protein